MSNLTFIWLVLSVMLNAVLIVTLIRQRRGRRHTHTWTPWSEWASLRVTHQIWQVYFRRVRYCTVCAQEEMQNVGNHECRSRNKYGELSCTHRERFTAIFDPMYEFKQLNKDLEELQ